MSFVNLHLHSMYSLQDGVINPSELVKVLSDYGQHSCAITDHGSIAGWYDFNKACLNEGIKPIFGNEIYCTKSYEEKSKNRDHLVLLAMNEEGLHNLRLLQKIAVQNFYYKPLLTYDIIKEHTDGLYCTSACSLGIISKSILEEDYVNAECYAELLNIYFDGNFSLELQFHPQYAEQSIINDYIPTISENFGIPMTVSTDAHFLNKDNQDVRKAIQAIAWRKQFNEVNDSLDSNCVGNDNLVRKFASESGFSNNDIVDKAIKQTNKISKMCNAKLEEPYAKVPVFNKHDKLDALFDEVM